MKLGGGSAGLFKILLFRPMDLFICFTYMFRNLRTISFCQGGLCGELKSVCVMDLTVKDGNKVSGEYS